VTFPPHTDCTPQFAIALSSPIRDGHFDEGKRDVMAHHRHLGSGGNGRHLLGIPLKLAASAPG